MISHALQIEIRIGSISLNRHNLQRPSKVLGVETRQRQSVAQAAHRRARLLISPSLRPDAKVRPVLVEHLDLARRVKVVPDLMDVLPLDAAALVADLHDHVGVAIAVAVQRRRGVNDRSIGREREGLMRSIGPAGFPDADIGFVA